MGPQTIGDARQIQSALEEAVKTSAVVELAVGLARAEGTLVFTREIYSPTEIGFHFKSTASVKEWVEKIRNPGDSKPLLAVKLAGSLILFEARLASYDSLKLIFEVPRTIQKVQRRKTVRVEIPERSTLRVRVMATDVTPAAMSKQIYDLSAGGIAFLVEQEEKSLFQVGDKIHQMQLILEGQSIVSSGTVRGIWGVRERRLVKIAVEFDKLSQKDESVITRYVFEMQRRKLKSKE